MRRVTVDRLSGQCIFAHLDKVIYGPGKVRAVSEELDRLGGKRVLVVTGRTLAASPLLKRVTDAVGDRCVGLFAKAGQHGPVAAVEELVEEMRRLEVDAV